MIPWGKFFENAGAAGFTPSDVKEMSLWEYNFTLAGFRKFHSSGESKASAPSEDEFERWMSLHGGESQSIKDQQ